MRFGLLLWAVGCAAGAQTADVIYYNGKFITLWSAHAQAQAVAIKNNRFLAVGSDAEVRATAGAGTEQIDLHGRTVLPGLNDSHTHPIGAALSEQDGPVPVMHSIADIQAYIRRQAAVTPADRMIFVPKVYSTRLGERRYPTRWTLSGA